METYLLSPIEVALDALFLDPNNPRISPIDPPGYEDLSALFDTSAQPAIEKTVLEKFDIAALVEGIIEQGWVPLDAILVWEPPKAKGKCVVLEGNRRTVALRQIVHQELPLAEKKWNTIQTKKSKYDEATVDIAKDRLDRIREIVKETRKLRVFPISAASTDELDRKLARVLGVRHISGARKWTNYAEDLYLLKRYTKVFKAKYPKEKMRLDQALITKVGEESSLLPVEARRKIQAASAHRHFRLEFEDKLPPGESFGETDHYLFEQIVRKPFLREQFQLGKDDLHIAPEGEKALFAWTFAKPRPKNADKNENILYRHENVSVWDQMKRYDDANKTSFASRFEVADPASAEPFRTVEAEWISHKAKQSPVDVVSKLVKQFEAMEVKTMLDSSAFIEPLLQRLGKLSAKYLKMLAAAH